MQHTKYHSLQERGNILQNSLTTLIFDMDNTLFDLVCAKTLAYGAITGRRGVRKAEELFSYFLRKHSGFADHGNIRNFMTGHSCYDEDHYRKCVSFYRKE